MEQREEDRSRETVTLFCFETGKYLNWGTLIGIDPAGKTAFLLSEEKAPKFDGVSGNSRDFGLALDSLISDLTREMRMPFSGFDYLSVLLNDYHDLKRMNGMKSKERDLFNFVSSRLDSDPKRLEVSGPTFSANEVKSRSVMEGFKLILDREARNFDSEIYIDFSGYLSGYWVSGMGGSGGKGLLLGIGGNILEAIMSSWNGKKHLQSFMDGSLPDGEIYEDVVERSASQVMDLVEVGRVHAGKDNVGGVPVNPPLAYEKNTMLIGSDEMVKNDSISKIEEIGKRVASYGEATLYRFAQKVFFRFVGRLVRRIYGEGMTGENVGIFISGAYCLWDGKSKISDYLSDLGFDESSIRIFFQENPSSYGILRLSKNLPKVDKINI